MDNQKITETAVKMMAACVKYRQPRLNDINKNIETYLNVEQPQLKGFSNVPMDFVVLSGFVDTLMAKIDDAPQVTFTEQTMADLKRAMKYTALWQQDSTDVMNNWDSIDRAEKKLAIFQGLGISKVFTESPYQANYDTIQLADFLFDPRGGANLEKHQFAGQESIYKTFEQLQEGTADGVYDKRQVEKLRLATEDTSTEKNDDLYKNKYRWQKSLGLDADGFGYSGDAQYNLTEMVLSYKGKRHYVLFDYSTGIWVRVKKIEDVFKSKLMPWTAWQTDNNHNSLLSKAPVDVIRPIAVSMKEVFNRALDNLNKTTNNMRAVDVAMVPNLNQLNWRHNGIVAVKSVNGRNVDNAIRDLVPPDRTNLIVNLTEYLDNFIAQKSGITASAQGASDKDTKVGVYYGDLQQVADRLGLLNKSYSNAWRQKALRWMYGVDEHLTEAKAIKIIGDKGAEWDEIKGEDKKRDKDFDVNISSGRLEAEFNEVKQKNRTDSLNALMGNPNIATKLNPNWVIEENLRNGGYEDEDIKTAQDLSDYGDRVIISEAAQENEDILKGKEVKPNRGATMGHLRYHYDFATDTELDNDVFKMLMAHIEAEAPYAEANAERLARSQIMASGGTLQEGGQPAQQGQAPIANTQAGTASKSQLSTELATP